MQREAAARAPGLVVPQLGLLRMNVLLLWRDPGPLVSRVVLPVLLLLVLRPLYAAALGGGPAGTRQGISGMAVMFSLLAVSMVGSGLLDERRLHTWDRLRASAASPASLLAGKALPVVVFIVLEQGVVIAVGAGVFGVDTAKAGLVALATVAWAVCVVGLGLLLGTLVRTYPQLAVAQDVGGLVLSILGGALVPLATLPSWVRLAAPLSPGYWGVRALGGALAGRPGPCLTAVAVLAAAGLAGAMLAYWRVQRSWVRAARS